MDFLRITLHSDGSSDAALLPIILWLIRQHAPNIQVEPAWADLRRLPRPPRELAQKIDMALKLYPCDILFVHRDAENQDHRLRHDEINRAIDLLRGYQTVPAHVCVIPIRMQEAWFLIDENALREAAGNPNGKSKLDMPNIAALEDLADPKDRLFSLIRTASELNARRRDRLPIASHAYRISSIISDFTPLRRLSAFKEFENQIQRVLRQHF